MESLLYFGKVNLCWILFYGCYWLLFRNQTFFRWNRLYLLFSLLTAFVLPFISFSETQQIAVIPNATTYLTTTPEITITPLQTSDFAPISWAEVLAVFYFLGVAFMFFRLASGLHKLARIIVKNEQHVFEDFTLIILPQNQSGHGSFSFFKWLVVSQKDYNDNLDTILRHEAVHVRQYHSLDVLLIEIIKTLFWMNPVLWLYKKSMQEIHEYLADEQARDKERYATFLVSYALQSPVKSLTNHFFSNSLLKSRIKMIYKNRTPRWLLGKYVIIIPVLLLVVSLTAARKHITTPKATIEERRMEETENVLEPGNTKIPESKITLTTVENVTIKGEIINKDGLPIHNAHIIVKNSNSGASSDLSGKFELIDVPANSQIVVSHVSYQSTEFRIEKSKIKYSIKLLPAENLIDEVVVVAYSSASSMKNTTEGEDDDAKKEYVVVEQKAEFPGGAHEMMLFLARKTLYPTRASRANISGTVIISFIVNEYGHIEKAEVIKGLGYGLDEEASRVVWSMPAWNPARQNGEAVASHHTIPIKFQLEPRPSEPEKKTGFFNGPQMPTDLKMNDTRFTFGDKNPLIFMDGIKQKERGNDYMSNVKTDNIQSISILKGQSATSMYGEEGKEGVILIQTKKSSGFLQQEPLELPGTGSKKYHKNESKNSAPPSEKSYNPL